MIIAGRVLANSIDNLTLQMGPDWQYIVKARSITPGNCSDVTTGWIAVPITQRVLSSCAYQGYCGAGSLPDNLYFYGNSPYQSQLLERYRAVLREAVETGDWSQLRFTRGGIRWLHAISSGVPSVFSLNGRIALPGVKIVGVATFAVNQRN